MSGSWIPTEYHCLICFFCRIRKFQCNSLMSSITIMIQSERVPVGETLEKRREINSREGEKKGQTFFFKFSTPHLLLLWLPTVLEVLTAMFWIPATQCQDSPWTATSPQFSRWDPAGDKSDSRSSHRLTMPPPPQTPDIQLLCYSALFSAETPTSTEIFIPPLYGRLSNCTETALIMMASPGRYRDLSVWMKVETFLGLKRMVLVFVKSRLSPL